MEAFFRSRLDSAAHPILMNRFLRLQSRFTTLNFSFQSKLLRNVRDLKKVIVFDRGLFSFASGFCIAPDSDESVPSLSKSVYDFEFLLSVESAQECPRPQKGLPLRYKPFSFGSGFCSAPDSDESVPSLTKSVYDFEFLLSVETAQECPRPQKSSSLMEAFFRSRPDSAAYPILGNRFLRSSKRFTTLNFSFQSKVLRNVRDLKRSSSLMEAFFRSRPDSCSASDSDESVPSL